jgi:hypothetical protein
VNPVNVERARLFGLLAALRLSAGQAPQVLEDPERLRACARQGLDALVLRDLLMRERRAPRHYRRRHLTGQAAGDDLSTQIGSCQGVAQR